MICLAGVGAARALADPAREALPVHPSPPLHSLRHGLFCSIGVRSSDAGAAVVPAGSVL